MDLYIKYKIFQNCLILLVPTEKVISKRKIPNEIDVV